MGHDVEAVAAFAKSQGISWGAKKELRRLAEALDGDETLLSVSYGRPKGFIGGFRVKGLIALTDRRFLVADGSTIRGMTFRSIPVEGIAGVEVTRRFNMASLKLLVSGQELVLREIQPKARGPEMADHLERLRARD